MSPNLDRISRKARAQPALVFTSLYPHITDIDHLRPCYHLLQGTKAVGVDEVTKAMYANDLDTTWRVIAPEGEVEEDGVTSEGMRCTEPITQRRL